MNRHSVFFKLNIMFFIALIAILVAGLSIMVHIQKQNRTELLYKSRLITKEYRITKKIPNHLYEEFNFKKVKKPLKYKILTANQMMRDRHARFMRRRVHIMEYNGKTYLYINTPRLNTLLCYEKDDLNIFLLPVLIMLGAIILLLSMYAMIRKTLIPLKSLERDMLLYGDGVVVSSKILDGKDEISLLSNAFYTSISKVKRLTDSRTLFVRNIFHELNTPVTKGKILTEIVDEPHTKSMLDSIFSRLTSLLKNLAQMEQITSQNYNQNITKVKLGDLIDRAKDILYIQDEIDTNIEDETVNADLDSMSIVFKNLIDNSMKYGKNLYIYYSKERINFISDGKALDGDFSQYLKAFSDKSQRDLQSQKQGFGLGLYICNEIILRHDMSFEYKHNNGKNTFSIVL